MGLDCHLKEVTSNTSTWEQNPMARQIDEISGFVKAENCY
jgi:hypothetical protein